MAKERRPEDADTTRDVGTAKKLTAFERLVGQTAGEGRSLGADDDPAREAWPCLWEWLTKIYLPGSRVQNPATVSIGLGPTGVVVTLTHRDQAVTLTAACDHLDGVFEALERALNSPHPPIRSHGSREPKTRKRNLGS